MEARNVVENQVVSRLIKTKIKHHTTAVYITCSGQKHRQVIPL